jgi:hypothetical protein
MKNSFFHRIITTALNETLNSMDLYRITMLFYIHQGTVSNSEKMVSVCKRIMIVLNTDMHFCIILHVPIEHQHFQVLKCLASFLLKPFLCQHFENGS